MQKMYAGNDIVSKWMQLGNYKFWDWHHTTSGTRVHLNSWRNFSYWTPIWHELSNQLKITGQNLGCVFNCRSGHACLCHITTLITKTALIKVENSAQTTFRFYPTLSALALQSNMVELDGVETQPEDAGRVWTEV